MSWSPFAGLEWTRGEFIIRLRGTGIGIVGRDAFAVSAPPEAVRAALGAPKGRQGLSEALRRVVDLLAEAPAISTIVVWIWTAYWMHSS
ncbi:hypothetical protein DS843_27025 [Roseomonas genomospecies 6]|uniref:Uncharacterized protein n=1 Tax=Roseomonas genomospecies 6 TaxID=214106 RepID=A0A9W7NFH9_9PROT|nr:hypothetical protein DS843_27025 [Roseomonas genomospecies 6]